jgi:hypothetical protein
MESLYTVKIPNKDYLDFLNDVVRMVTIQITIQFLFYINSPGEVNFFSVDFILMIIYMILGICVYWLIIKKLVLFK